MSQSIFLRKVLEIIKNPLSVFMILIIPIAASFLISSFFEKNQEQFVLPIAVVDEDESGFSKLVRERLAENPNLNLRFVSAKEADRLLKKNEVDSAILIKEGFEQKLLQQEREDVIETWVTPISMAMGIVRELVASEVTRLTSNIEAADRVVQLYRGKGIVTGFEKLWEQAYQYSDGQWAPEPLMTVDYVTFSAEDGEIGKERENFTKSQSLTAYFGYWSFFTMLSIFISMSWIVREQRKLFPRIHTMRKGISRYLFQAVGAYWFLYLVQAVLALAIFKSLRIAEFELITIIYMSVFMLVNMTISMLLASFFEKASSYDSVSIVIVLALGIIGGSLFPVQDLSSTLTQMTIFLPQGLLLTNVPDLQKAIQIVSAIALSVVFWGISLWRFKKYV